MKTVTRTQQTIRRMTPAGIALVLLAGVNYTSVGQNASSKPATFQIADEVAEQYYNALVRRTDEVKRVRAVIQKFGPKKGNAPQPLASLIVKESRSAGLDPLFVAAVVKSESTFRTTSLSNKNARGLMQITPITETEVRPDIDLSGLHGRDLHDPQYNLRIGITYIKQLEARYKGNRKLALIAYNWGPGNVQKALKGDKSVPTESIQYAQKIISNHRSWSANG